MKIAYMDGIGLKQAVIAAARRVILMQEKLNRINVFPVPDNDTGTNMALTMQRIAEGAINCPHSSVSEMSQCLADSAIMGARGNSGAILAQFFQGFADRFEGQRRVSLTQFGEAVIRARDSSYEAITEPKEGTILTVIHDWAEKIKTHCCHANDFLDLLKEGLHEAERSLKETPKKLKLLARAGVVDAGAQGFVHMLEGVHHFMQSGKIEKVVGIGGAETASARVANAPEQILFQYCTECLIADGNIDRRQLREELSKLGNSLIVAGSKKKVRVHIHTNEPKTVFETASTYGTVSKQKFDDMRKQHVHAHSPYAAAKIALVTDSSCDLSPEFIIRHNVQMVPVQILFGKENYIDKITITPEEFYRMLETNEQYPKTSQPTPGDFRNTYRDVLGHYEQVVSVSLSGALSGTLQASQTAAKSVSADKIHVLNSRNTSVALGLVVAEAASAIQDGCELADVIARTEWAIANVRFFIAFRSVEYLVKGGRLSISRGLLARAFHLNPVLTVNRSGAVEMAAKTFDAETALAKVMEFVSKASAGKKNLRFGVAHANAPEKAAWLEGQLKQRFDTKDMIVTNVSPALGAHTGPGAAGVAFLGE
ncbi:MAG: DAK2 domain-containing protein [bacterium]